MQTNACECRLGICFLCFITKSLTKILEYQYELFFLLELRTCLTLAHFPVGPEPWQVRSWIRPVWCNDLPGIQVWHLQRRKFQHVYYYKICHQFISPNFHTWITYQGGPVSRKREVQPLTIYQWDPNSPLYWLKPER